MRKDKGRHGRRKRRGRQGTREDKVQGKRMDEGRKTKGGGGIFSQSEMVSPIRGFSLNEYCLQVDTSLQG